MSDQEASIVRIDREGHRVIARVVCPHLGQREASIFYEEVSNAAKPAGHRVAIDFTGVTMLGSMGLGQLVRITTDCKAGKGKCVVFGLDPQILELVKMSRLDRAMVIKDNEKAALKALG